MVCPASAITPSISALLRCKHAVWFIVEWTQWRVTSHWMLMHQSLTLHTNAFPLCLCQHTSRTISPSILLCLSFLVLCPLSCSSCQSDLLSSSVLDDNAMLTNCWATHLCFLHSGIVWVVKTTRKLGNASGSNIFLCSSYFFLFLSAPIVARARNSHRAPVFNRSHTPGF